MPSGSELPQGRYGQALAVALALIPALLLWAVVLVPLRGCYDARASRLAQDRALAARMQAAADALPRLRDAARREAHADNSPHLLLEGDSDAVAAASLQETLQTMAASAGVTIASTDTLPPVPQGDYRRIAVRLTLSSDWSSLVGLLRTIETATPRLLVDDLQVQGGAGGLAILSLAARSKASGAGAGLGGTGIDAAVTIFGLRAAGG